MPRVLGQDNRDSAVALRVGHLAVTPGMVETESSVGMDLGQADHAVSPEVSTSLAHLIGRDGVVAGLTRGVRDRQRRDDRVPVELVAIEKCDALGAGSLAGELVKERLPNGLRQDEAHRDLDSKEARAPRPDGSMSQRQCAVPAATSDPRSGSGWTCSTPRSC